MAALLSADDVRTALAALPGWEGGTDGLVRTLAVPEAGQDEVERALKALGDERNHHPDVTRGPEGLRLVLSTHSAGGVTAKDVDLAAAIDLMFPGEAPGA